MATTGTDTGSQWRIITDDPQVIAFLDALVRKNDTGAQWVSKDGTTYGCDRETAAAAVALGDS